jgi:flavin-dependent dehydrogenase
LVEILGPMVPPLGGFTWNVPHMEYEASIGFVMRKIKKKIADFQVLELFMAKKHDLSDKKFPSVTRRCRT